MHIHTYRTCLRHHLYNNTSTSKSNEHGRPFFPPSSWPPMPTRNKRRAPRKPDENKKWTVVFYAPCINSSSTYIPVQPTPEPSLSLPPPCSSLGDPTAPAVTIKTGGRGGGRASPLPHGPASPAGGLATPGAKKDRVPNHWWELELTAEGPMLYPTSNCHEWTSDNGIEHRIMEIEFQHGCEVCTAVVWFDVRAQRCLVLSACR